MASFLEQLNQPEVEKARPKSRRILELLPDIEAAIAKGFSRAQIVDALKKSEGIDITPSMLSTYVRRWRQRRRPGAPSPATAAPSPVEFATPAKAVLGQPGSNEPAPASTSPLHGEHDRHPVDKSLSATQDMNALARQGRKGSR
ncbi:MAG: hypothetical protein JF606_25270 [Burkholderiales bacterium]|jgi:hypothetical protein|nr:hypothetical protein [Burkholderiales bacterium]